MCFLELRRVPVALGSVGPQAGDTKRDLFSRLPNRSRCGCKLLSYPVTVSWMLKADVRLLGGDKELHYEDAASSMNISLLTPVNLASDSTGLVWYGCESWTIKKAEC